jgi:hypothetical protein
LKAAGALGLASATPSAWAQAVREAADELGGDIDSYYLDAGDMSPAEAEQVASHIAFQDQDVDGRMVMRPRGRKPDRAPTYRFLHWRGDLDDDADGFIGPLTLKPTIDTPPPYRFNAQILGFNTADGDFKKKGDGTLSVEFRARHKQDIMTWLHLQSFAVENGANNIGREYVAQRDGSSEDVISEDANVDMRIQLIRHQRPPGTLRKLLGVASSIMGAAIPAGPPVGMPGRPPMGPPAMMRIPRMAREAVALAQATLGGAAEERPIWRSGFTTYGLASGGSRLTLNPGLWVAMDSIDGVNAKDLRLTEGEGSIVLTHNGQPAEFSYLVLDVEIESV